MRLERKLRAFWDLSPSDRVVFVSAWTLLPLAHLASPFVRYERDSEPRRNGSLSFDEAQRVRELTDAAARNTPFDITCLERSLVTWLLLRAKNTPSSLRISVEDTEPARRMHAWVELGGQALSTDSRHRDAFAECLVPAGLAPRR